MIRTLSIEIAPWLHISPNVQVIDPSDEKVDTDVIAGIRATIDF